MHMLNGHPVIKERQPLNAGKTIKTSDYDKLGYRMIAIDFLVNTTVTVD